MPVVGYAPRGNCGVPSDPHPGAWRAGPGAADRSPAHVRADQGTRGNSESQSVRPGRRPGGARPERRGERRCRRYAAAGPVAFPAREPPPLGASSGGGVPARCGRAGDLDGHRALSSGPACERARKQAICHGGQGERSDRSAQPRRQEDLRREPDRRSPNQEGNA